MRDGLRKAGLEWTRWQNPGQISGDHLDGGLHLGAWTWAPWLLQVVYTLLQPLLAGAPVRPTDTPHTPSRTAWKPLLLIPPLCPRPGGQVWSLSE